MQADRPRTAADQTLEKYIDTLHSEYSALLGILELQARDISESDENRLTVHAGLEAEKVKAISSLTTAVRTYSENVYLTETSGRKLSEISDMKRRAAEQSRRNIAALKNELAALRVKLESIKLPQSARRVYYSGNNPTLMDIEI